MSTFFLKQISECIAIAPESHPSLVNYIGWDDGVLFIIRNERKSYLPDEISVPIGTKHTAKNIPKLIATIPYLFELLTNETHDHRHILLSDFNPDGFTGACKESYKLLSATIESLNTCENVCESKHPKWKCFTNLIKSCENAPEKQLFDYDYEIWLHDHLGALAGLIPSPFPALTTPPTSWQWCGNPQNSFDIKTPPVFKFTPHTTKWRPGDQGTCDLTDAAPVLSATSPRRPALDAVGKNFIEAKTTGGNTVTITERSHALIKAALENSKGIWIMICTDWTATKDHFHPEDIIIIGPTTLKTKHLWNIPPTPPGAARTSQSELRLESGSYTLRFPNGETGRNFSLEKSKDYTLHFHRPNGGSINTNPPPKKKTYTYPDPTTGPTNLYIYD